MERILKMSESSKRSRSARVWVALLCVTIFCLCAATVGAASTAPQIVVSQINYLAPIDAGGGGTGRGGSFADNQNGDIVVGNEWGNTLYLINSKTGAATTLGSWGNIGPIAIDAQNNAYIAELYGPTIIKLPYVNGAYATFTNSPAGGCTGTDTAACTINNLTFSGDSWWFGTWALAVDAAGDLFVGITNSPNLVMECNLACEYAKGSPTVLFTETKGASMNIAGLSVDANNNLYISDNFNETVTTTPNNFISNVWELPYTAGAYAATPTKLLTDTNSADYISDVASDATGNLYVAYSGSGIYVLPDGDSAKEYAISGMSAPQLTIDTKGNVYAVVWNSAFDKGAFGVAKITVNNIEAPAATVSGKATTASNVSVVENGVTCAKANPTITFTAREEGASSSEFTGSVPGPTGKATSTCQTTITGSYFPITVTFNPTTAGGRSAELIADDTTNSVSGKAIAYGVGQGVIVTLDPATTASFTSASFVAPASVAVDAAGDVFVADPSAKKVFEIAAGSTSPVSIGTGFSEPTGLALDANGNLFISDIGTVEIYEIANSGTKGGFTAGTQSTLISSSVMFGGAALAKPVSLAFSGSGLLYILDGNHGCQIVTYNIFTGSTGVLATALGDESQIAVDDSENVYVASSEGVLLIAGDIWTVLSSIPGAANPNGVAVDASGSVIVSDQDTGNIVRIPNKSGVLTVASAITIEKTAGSGQGLALDPSGNLYVANGKSKAVDVYQRNSASVNFGTVTDGDQSATATIYAENAGNVALTSGTPFFVPLSVTDFTLATPSGDGCTGGSTGPVGEWCALTAQFDPSAKDSGAVSTSTTLKLTALNSATFTVNLSGTAKASAKTAQTISFTAPKVTTYTYPAGPLTVSATSTSKLAVALTLDSKSTGTGSFNSTKGVLTITSAGTFIIDANQAGNSTYAAAKQVQLTITVKKAAQTIAFTKPTTTAYTYPVTAITLAATGGKSGNAIIFTVDAKSTTGAGSITGSTLKVKSAGTIIVDANQAGNSTYAAAAQKQLTITVKKAAQTITFTAPASPVTYGVKPITLAATASSKLTVVFSVVSGPGKVSGSTLTITGAGMVIVAANQAGNADYNAATAVKRSIVVNKAATTAALTSSVNPSIVGQSVKLTATVKGQNGGTATGTVTFSNGSKSLGIVSLSGGKAVLATTTLPAGTDLISAVYSGDANFAGSQSNTVSQVVGKAATLSSPKQGATLTGSSQTFTWASATGATSYTLWLGSTEAGSANLYSKNTTAGTLTLTATNLPVNGKKIYARLLTDFNGIWTYNDYTFTAFTKK
jgi:sugar lactone lactonase YvrE